MPSKNDFRDLRRAAEKQGWTIETSRGGHLKWKSPNGKTIFSSATPSDKRAVNNHLSLLRRAGFATN